MIVAPDPSRGEHFPSGADDRSDGAPSFRDVPLEIVAIFVVTFCLSWWSRALLYLLYKPWVVILQLATLVASFKLASGRVGVLTLGSLGCRNLLVMS